MGILNSSGEYVINLDPDDKFSNSKNLEQLYNITSNSKYDFILFLIKRLSTNYKENYYTNLENKLQLQKQDFRITNKLIKRKKMLTVYKYYKKYINGNKWNYHDDNIWNLLIRHFSKKIKIFNFINFFHFDQYSLINIYIFIKGIMNH